MNWLQILVAAMFLAGCGASIGKEQAVKVAKVQEINVVAEPAVVVPVFDADSAYSFIEAQVNFGPRVPSTASHRACSEYLISKFESYGATVVAQEVDLKAYNGDLLEACNIIARFQPEKQQRVMLCAHWDTRPWADTDPDKSNHYKPLPGANDGGSGVGVLLEVARHLADVQPKVGIDIVLFDAEDYGLHENDSHLWKKHRHSWALGSQYWSINPHIPGYSAKYGILLDIVGAPNSRFLYEGYSTRFAPEIVQEVWRCAGKLGYGNYFINEEGGFITDDHYYVNNILGLPCIDIINCDPDSPNGFGPYHHTMKDDMDWIDKNTLKAVGQTVMTVIYNEK